VGNRAKRDRPSLSANQALKRTGLTQRHRRPVRHGPALLLFIVGLFLCCCSFVVIPQGSAESQVHRKSVLVQFDPRTETSKVPESNK
jgi:hypothetical protein